MNKKNINSCSRICNCVSCSFLKCEGRRSDTTGGFGFFYYCQNSAASFPYGINCIFHDGFYNLIRIYKISAVVDSTVKKIINEPFYVFGANKRVAKMRFRKEFPLLDILFVEQCTEQEGVDILLSDNIEVL